MENKKLLQRKEKIPNISIYFWQTCPACQSLLFQHRTLTAKTSYRNTIKLLNLYSQKRPHTENFVLQIFFCWISTYLWFMTRETRAFQPNLFLREPIAKMCKNSFGSTKFNFVACQTWTFQINSVVVVAMQNLEEKNRIKSFKYNR